MKPNTQHFKVSLKPGMNALDFVLLLPTVIPNLARLEFTIYTPTEGAKKRISKSRLTSAKLKSREHLRHDANKNRRMKVSVVNLAARLSTAVSHLSNAQALGINSRCRLKGGAVKQIPMIDFKPKPGKANLRLIKECVIEMGQSGVLFETGASYHFYGFGPLNEKEWISFLGDSLLAKFSDSRWIGHSLLQRTSVLRVTSSKLKPKIPVVRLVIGPSSVESTTSA